MNRRSTAAIGLIVSFLLVIVSGYGQTVSNEECLDCHSDSTLTKTLETGQEKSLFVDLEKFTSSLHGEFECVVCHTDIEEIPHEEDLKKGDCSICHEDIAEEYMQSLHGRALSKGEADAPHCSDCHGYHYIQPSDDSLSMIFPANIPHTCAKCHADLKIVKKYDIPNPSAYESYLKSIHFKRIKEGDKASAVCNNCHSSHSLQPSTDPSSMIYRSNIPKTCGQCHGDVYEQYSESVHGKAALAGVTDSPVCTDCHREHSIQASDDPAASIYPAAVSKNICARCHEAERIVTRYGLAVNVVESYFESYHGLADRAGTPVTANCASCHGVHDIRPSSDPKSSVHKDNLAATCGKCHPDVNENVAIGSVHILPSEKRHNALLYYIRLSYISLIILIIGGMILHNGLDFIIKIRARYKGLEFPHHPGADEATFVRLTLNERIQHVLLFTSFTILVITGFALVYPESWWARPLFAFEKGFAFRGFLHRLAAVVNIALAIYHVYYLIFVKRGREQFKALMPNLKDVQDVLQMFRYYLGLSKQKAQFDRYNYAEKAEYWALIWGTIVMTTTGLILWFNNFAMRIFPKWVMDVATVVHLYEAILATLAIIVWHFYFVFLSPNVYPINFACITGKVSEEEMKEEHPLEYERLMREGQSENED